MISGVKLGQSYNFVLFTSRLTILQSYYDGVWMWHVGREGGGGGRCVVVCVWGGGGGAQCSLVSLVLYH